MRLRTTATALLVFMTTASLVIACSVPVFRYALEHWRPDAYTVFVFAQGELSQEHQAIVKSMQPTAADGSLIANVIVETIDVESNADPAMQKMGQDLPSDSLPWMVVQSPAKWGPSQIIWQGALSEQNSAMVMDSPARTTVAKNLVNGDSVVWVLLECGRPEADDAAFTMLSEEIKKLETSLKLPDIEDEDLGDLSVNPEALKIAFSAVRISRDDSKEQAFVEMLLRVEPDLRDKDMNSQPMAFPIFGRGRALYALVGKGIAPDVIADASQFLCGACQCTVKAQNPGVDLIMNVDWNQMVIPTEPLDEDLPPLAGFSGFGLPDDENNESTENIVTATSTASIENAQADGSVGSLKSGSTMPVAPVAPVTNVAAVTVNDAPSAALGQNVLFVLMFLAIGVVVATLVFRPRTS